MMSMLQQGWKQHLASLVCMKCGKLFDNQTDRRNHIEERHPPSQRQLYIQQAKNNVSSMSNSHQVLTEHSPDQVIKLGKRLRVSSLPSSSSESDVYTENKKPTNKNHVHKKPNKKSASKEKIVYKHECRFCSKTFITPSKLKRHVLTHTNTKPYKCLECHKKFSRYDNLITHEMAVHYKVKVYECTACRQGFSSKQSLQYHSLVCTGTVQQLPRHFECGFCKRSFTKKSSLCSHVACMHLELRPHACKICPRKFYRSSHLRRHVASMHRNRRPFWCAHCHHRSATKSNMVIHILSVHKPKSEKLQVN